MCRFAFTLGVNFLPKTVHVQMRPLRVTCDCFSTGFGNTFWSFFCLREAAKTHWKTYLNFNQFLDFILAHFGSLFWLRLVVPDENFRLLAVSTLPSDPREGAGWFLEVVLRTILAASWSRFWRDFRSFMTALGHYSCGPKLVV